VNAFEGDGGRERVGGGGAEEIGGGEREDGAEAFATGLEAVAHGFVQARRPGGGAREQGIERGFNAGGVGVKT
jgi:hypothetical protein